MRAAFDRSRRAAWAACALILAAAPALAETVKGNGVMRTEARQVSGFTSVGLGIAGKVEVKIGPTESVTVEADENLLPLIETSVKRGTLEIKSTRRNLSFDSRSIRIVVQAKQVEGLAIGGSGSIMSDALRASRLKFDIGGSGTIDVKRVDAERVEVSIGGSGDVKLAGTASKLDVSIGGSGGVVAPSLVADKVEISVAGSGAAQVAARSLLDVTLAGSGSVQYWGDPTVKRTVVGVGAIKRMGPLPQ